MPKKRHRWRIGVFGSPTSVDERECLATDELKAIERVSYMLAAVFVGFLLIRLARALKVFEIVVS